MAPKSDKLAEESADSSTDEASEEASAGGEDPPAEKKKKKRKPKPPPDEAEWTPQPIVSTRTGWLLALVSAILCPISFAGFDVWPLAFVAWVPLILAMRGQTPRRAAYLGWFAGFGMTMIGFYWLVGMLETFSGFPLPVCALFAAIVCLEKGGRVALMGWMYARATQRGWHHALSFLAAFGVSELVWPVLFPWYFGASMHNTPIMMQTADLGGVILVSVVVLAVNVAVAEALNKAMFQTAPDRRTLIGGAVTLAFALGYGAFRLSSIDATVAASEAIQVGMVQGNRPLRNAIRQGPRTRERPVDLHIRHTRDLAKQGVDLVVWSEAASQASFDVATYENAASATIGRRLGVPTIIGAVLREPLESAGPKGRKARYFNTALMVDGEGQIVGRYDKFFLLMFGEYLPWGDTFPILYEWSPNSGAFSKGSLRKPLMFGEHPITPMICYEDIIPSYVDELMDAGESEMLVNMTNDTWFGATIEPDQHLALAKFRSVEHRKFMARVTNTGMTAMIDPVGRVTASGSFFAADGKNVDGETIVAEARFMKVAAPYTSLGQKPWWVLTLLMAAACFVRRTPRDQST